MKEFNKIIAVAIIALVIGIGIGMAIGVEMTITKVANIASRFIKIDPFLVRQAINQYSNNIGGCYPVLINITGTNITG